LHPVTIELVGKAKELAAKTDMQVSVVLIGYELDETAESLLDYGVSKVYVYDDKELESFRVDAYANVMADIINTAKPSVVLVGGTSIGRSLAPRVATRFKTGLTADCTKLDIKDNTDLVQIRPAFGGNIMAQIITTHTRPQFATVRYKVMDSAKKTDRIGEVIHKKAAPEMLKSDMEVIRIQKKEKKQSITEADVLVVAGQGVKSKEDLTIVQKLADILGGQMASTRPMVEKGWIDYTKQIGLSGRTVKPKLIITCGVSGAIQFCACMNSSDMIIAINSDENAPIFKIAHYGIVGDLYKVVPELIERIEGSVKDAV
jgi:electron transfer flavoprotein alpha subunit